MARSSSPFIWWRYARCQRSVACSKLSPSLTVLSRRPGLASQAHVPEHPLVAARGDEVAAHRFALGGRQALRHLVRRRQHVADDRPELLGRVRADPALVERVGGARALELL